MPRSVAFARLMAGDSDEQNTATSHQFPTNRKRALALRGRCGHWQSSVWEHTCEGPRGRNDGTWLSPAVRCACVGGWPVGRIIPTIRCAHVKASCCFSLRCSCCQPEGFLQGERQTWPQRHCRRLPTAGANVKVPIATSQLCRYCTVLSYGAVAGS